MIAVSDGWKAAHEEALLPETFIELTYSVTEPGVQEDASSSATVEESFSDAASLVSTLPKHPEKYAVLEHNSWLLNGELYSREESSSDLGYVTSALSGADATFTNYPTVTVAFSQVHTELIPGVTIVWSEAFGEYASSFRVRAFNGGTTVAQATIEGNTDTTSVVWLDMVNYDSITVEILSWSHPLHRARVTSIHLGVRVTYNKGDFLRYSHSQSVDLLSAALPKNQISFVLRNDDGRWNPENPTGAEKYLIERQEIHARYGMLVNGEIEWIDGGRFFLSGWTTPANGLQATFTARDALEFMNEVYTGTKSGTLYAIAVAAFKQADLPLLDSGEARYFVDASLKNYSTTFTNEYKISEVLQMVAHMACSVIYQRRDGVVYLGPVPAEQGDYVVSRAVSYAHPEFVISKPLKAVSVGYGDSNKALVSVGESGEVQTVNNAFILIEADALRVAQAAVNVLAGRKTISGEYRADPRLDPLDTIEVESKYAVNNVVITSVEYSTSGGSFRGKYTGRVIKA
ncbi:MAG: hypothetical protein IJY96_01560 [Oscillospiraceae bacterium]|nr:hypothetical protein [Oscillospiraceae bacterium]